MTLDDVLSKPKSSRRGFYKYSEAHSFNAHLPKGGKGISPKKKYFGMSHRERELILREEGIKFRKEKYQKETEAKAQREQSRLKSTEKDRKLVEKLKKVKREKLRKGIREYRIEKAKTAIFGGNAKQRYAAGMGYAGLLSKHIPTNAKAEEANRRSGGMGPILWKNQTTSKSTS